MRWHRSVAEHAVCKEAVRHVRERRGYPLLCMRMSPARILTRSLVTLYKTPEERESETRRDPLLKFSLFLIREGLMDEVGRG